jgi:hypothetical protein
MTLDKYIRETIILFQKGGEITKERTHMIDVFFFFFHCKLNSINDSQRNFTQWALGPYTLDFHLN